MASKAQVIEDLNKVVGLIKRDTKDITPEEKKHSMDFPFKTEGIWQAVQWLNEEHQAGHY